MKRLLIVNNNLHIGGVQKSLVNLLGEIHGQYRITLALFHPAGQLLQQIPEDVEILPVRSAYRFLGMTKYDVANRPLWKLGRSIFAAISRLLGRNAAVCLMAPGQKKLTGYDAAISYLHNSGDKVFYGGCNDFVLRHVEAKKKITVLHGDFSACGANTPKNRKQYAGFDVVAACSEGCAERFKTCVPELSHKVKTLYNCHDFAGIRAAAAAMETEFPANRCNIVTVARLGKEKGVIRGIEAFGEILASCDNFYYYIVGDGVQRGEIQARIQQLHLEDHVTLLGEQANPYGYIRAADLLLIPSVSEAAPMVIAEAACLGTPILSTRTSSAEDMITKTGFGWVCDNSVPGIIRGLTELLQTPALLEEKRQSLRAMCFDNEAAKIQLEQVL